MKLDLPILSKLMKDISSIITIQSSHNQSLTILDMLISNFLEEINASYAYVSFPINDSKGNLIETFERSFGMPKEQCALINKHVNSEYIPSNSRTSDENYFVYVIDKFGSQTGHIDSIIKEFQIQTILAMPLETVGLTNTIFTLYFTQVINLTKPDIQFLLSFTDMICSSYLLKVQYVQSVKNRLEDASYFLDAPEPIIILSENLEILNYNDSATKLIHNNNNTKSAKLSHYLDPESESIVQNLIVLLRENETSIETQVAWRLPFQNDKGQEISRINFLFKKISDINNQKKIIATGRIQEYREARKVKDTLGATGELIPRLSELKEKYYKNPDETIITIKNELFPAAFILLVNEETGPMPIASSPDIDAFEIMQETIRLMAGLSTDQIVQQHYITGTTPWTKPDGEFRWISFYRPNQEARGNLEFHLIGILTKQNLFAIVPSMIRISLGILLGAMNTYLEILDDDQADFVTKKYSGDRNFSTISLIKEALEEIRMVTAEIFAATLTGVNTNIRP